MTVPKAITGFVLGVLATLAAVYWLDEDMPASRRNPIHEPLPPDGPNDGHRGLRSAGIDEAADEGANDPIARPSRGTASNDLASAIQDEPAVVPQRVTGVANPGRESDVTAASDRYPPEIAEMIENRVDRQLQARYENDEREASWAAYMEDQLASYFAEKPLLAQFHISLIDCRTSVCSVHVLGYGPDALTRWNTATADLVSQQWFEFNNMSMNRRNPVPDVLAVVLILTKKPPG